MSSTDLSPSYCGFVGSTKDAVLIIQAVLDKKLYLTPRRPHERERASTIKSGNVFVFIEEQSGIKRWTDGIAWSPSRILGRFLVYRELDKQSLNEKDEKKKKKRNASMELDPLQVKQDVSHTQFINPAHQVNESNASPERSELSKNLVGSLATSHVFKDHGLIKKTLSVSTSSRELNLEGREEKQTIHLISYYNADDVLNAKLIRPSETDLKTIAVSNDLWSAIKDSSLGGKIPIEDEAHYFLDNNYQLQHMASLQQFASQQHRQVPQYLAQHNTPYAQSSIVQPQYVTPPKYTGQILQPTQQSQYMLPLPVQIKHPPPPHFSSPVTYKDDYNNHHGLPASGVKRDDEFNHGNSSELTFINPFTGSIHQTNQGSPYAFGTGSAPGSSYISGTGSTPGSSFMSGTGSAPGSNPGSMSGASTVQPYNNYALPQQQVQQQHPNYHYQYDTPSSYTTSFYPPVSHSFQQIHPPHVNNHQMSSFSSSNDQQSSFGTLNGHIPSVKSSNLHGSSSNSIGSPPSSNYQQRFRSSSSSTSAPNSGWIPSGSVTSASAPLFNTQQIVTSDLASNVEPPLALHHISGVTQLNTDDSNTTTNFNEA